ncbi:type II toxin-antitoxin system Phd/YefM family antitoxin [Roseicella aquatilis]|uniref:Antitoxin n=1 Tax=Roseicella aquatilis TaxID=2527868 RepID=A0A4R4DTJ6_9PROT|nr:type II toxin-antitoxin system prevent-host-death family antitoxin [Roseicella aquatilis]TCZ65342.1 type II toxin-antitoxin system prevent-host-death family antitoxin [Roseicella aquatilis]
MVTVTLADAKTQLSALVERAARGETVQITRCGKPVAQITPIEAPRKRISLEELRAFTDSLRIKGEPEPNQVRRMRDGDRY